MSSSTEPAWEAFRDRVTSLASLREDEEFLRYVAGVTERMWCHVLEDEHLQPEQAESRLFGFFQEDRRFFTGG